MEFARLVVGVVVGLGMASAGCATDDQDDTTRNDRGDMVAASQAIPVLVQPGDCLAVETPDSLDPDVIATDVMELMAGVPCSTPHDVEVYHSFLLPEGTYPGDAAIVASAADGCREAFEAFVGHDDHTSVYDFSYLSPSSESWDERQDRDVHCLMANFDGTKKIGTAQNTGI